MVKRFRSVLALAFALCLLATSTYAQASSAEVDRLKQEVENAAGNRKELDNQKTEKENQNKELANQAETLTGKISTLNSQISTVTGEINSTEEEIAEVEAQIEELNGEIEDTMASLDLQRNSMKKRIQYMYENQSTNVLVALLQTGSLTELLRRLEYMSQISAYDQDAILKYEQTQAVLEITSAQVEEKKEELVSYQDNLSKKKSELGGLVNSTTSALNDTNNQISDNQAAIAELDEKIKEAKAYEQSILQQYMAAQVAYAESIAGETGHNDGSYTSSDEDVLLLAAVIQAEADNQGDAGRLAVGSVVMNRVYSSKFPNSIAGVVYSPNQFAPVASGRVAAILAKGPNSNCQYAAALAISGTSNTNALFFCTYSYAQNLHNSQVAEGKVGFLDRTEGMVLGAHYFYNYR